MNFSELLLWAAKNQPISQPCSHEEASTSNWFINEEAWTSTCRGSWQTVLSTCHKKKLYYCISFINSNLLRIHTVHTSQLATVNSHSITHNSKTTSPQVNKFPHIIAKTSNLHTEKSEWITHILPSLGKETIPFY